MSVALAIKVYPAFTQRYIAVEDALVRFLKNRELFFVADSAREEVWLNVLRIAAGYMLFERSFQIFYYEVVMDGAAVRSLVSLVDLVSSFCVMIGFMTPLFLGILFLFHTYIHDILLQTYTLGSCVAQILLMIFLFVPAGRRLSLDALIMSTRSIGAGLLIRLYAFVGIPTSNRIAVLKFCAFISYGLLCLFSVYGHIYDPYWWNGTANVFILTSNWLVGPYQLFREIFAEYGKAAIIVSMISLYIMMFWELVIIPFTLIKGFPRYFVIGW